MTDGEGAFTVRVRIDGDRARVAIVPAGPTAARDPVAGDMDTEVGGSYEAMRKAVHLTVDALFDDPAVFGISKLLTKVEVH